MRTITAAQAAVRASGSQSEHVRVQVKDSGGTFRDLTTYPGFNAVDSVTVSNEVGSPHMTADVSLTREFFKLSLSPLMVGSALNRGFNPAASPVALLALSREFKVEVAIVPMDRAPGAGDWMEVFRGRIDNVDPAAGNQVRFGGRDLAGRIADQQIKKERIYAFATDGSPVSLRPWEPGMVAAVGEYVLPASNSDNDPGANKFLKCTTAGTSGNTEPVWTTGSSQVDGTIRWNYIGAPSSSGRPVEAVMQNLLDDNKAASDSSVTLYTPTSPSWAIKQYIQSRDRNLQAIRALAQQIGWDTRQKWRAGTSQFELTLFEPERAKTTADYTFAAADYGEPTKLETAIENIRNAWRVIYSDSSDLWPDGSPKRKVIEVQDSASIAKYGELWAEIAEASASNVDTSTEATKLVNAALSDCAEPTADVAISPTQCFPWVELGDLYTFAADGRRYDSDQKFAVTGWKLVGEKGKLRTELTLRGKPALSAWAWIATSTVMPFITAELQSPPKYTHFPGGKTPTISTLKVPGGVGLVISGDQISSKRGDPEYEIHTSKTSGFTPDATTLHSVIKDRMTTIAELQPGVTRYGRMIPRLRDRGGKLARGQPGAQFTFTPSRVKSGLIDRLAVAGGVPNGDFKDIFDPNPEASLTPPEHWSILTGTFGPSGDARVLLDGTYGLVLSLQQTATNAQVRSAIWRTRLGATRAVLALRVRPKGTLSAGRNLFVHVEYFADGEGLSGVGDFDTVVPYNFLVANTWGVYTETLKIPTSTSYMRVTLYKEATSSAYGWDVAEVQLSESGMIQPPWVAAAYVNGFADLDATTFQPGASFMDSLGVVHLRGLVKRATAALATTIFTLPVGEWPAKKTNFLVMANGNAARLEIGTAGTVQIVSAVDANWFLFFSLDGVTFDTR